MAAKKAMWMQDLQLTYTAMSHADGSIPGDWYLSNGEVQLLRRSPGYEKFVGFCDNAG